jgi:nucleoside-diphosphate kinase
MALERTVAILKPEVVAARRIGEILTRMEGCGLRLIAARVEHWTSDRAEAFYAAHRGQPFYPPLIAHMCSGPILILVLEGEGAVARYRELMGATDPQQAAPGTLRADFGTGLPANAVHGSDGTDSAAAEIAFFFAPHEVI